MSSITGWFAAWGDEEDAAAAQQRSQLVFTILAGKILYSATKRSQEWENLINQPPPENISFITVQML